MKKTSKKQNLFMTCIVMALIAGLLIVYFTCIQKPQEGSKTITINVEHLDKEKYKDSVITIKTDEEYLRKAVESIKLVDGTESEYGLWIKTVDKETADDAKQQWWSLYVNGEFGSFGIDEQPVADGDSFTFKLVEGY